MRRFHLRWWPGLLAGGSLLLILVNSMGCNYSMYVSHPPMHYYMTCEWGKVRIVEANILNGEEWRINAFQLAFLDQLLYLINERTLLRPARQVSQSDMPPTVGRIRNAMISFGWTPLDAQHIALFRSQPKKDLRVAHLEGRLSLLSPLTPLRAGNARVDVSMDDTAKTLPAFSR